jgi:hypothetical protein
MRAQGRSVPSKARPRNGQTTSSVSADTAQLLRTAALLGGRFAVTDLSMVARRPVSALAASLQGAVTAGIVDGAGAVRHARKQGNMGI